MSDSKRAGGEAEGLGAAGAPIDAEAIVEAIRGDSAEARLTRLSGLRERFPGLEVAGLIEAAEAEDLKTMAGRSERYYFSAGLMTEAYALHLFRVEERDPVLLVAGTVRDESRIYPRPTDARTFQDPPFNLTETELVDTLGRMSLRPDCADIRSARASNGALYLYSTLHLGEAQAEALVEWIEVGQRENP